MKYLYLTETQARYLFLNKYLVSDKFGFGDKPNPDLHSFEFFTGNSPEKVDNEWLVFLSQFCSATIKSETELEIFSRVYSVPHGFLTLSKIKSSGEIPYSETVQEPGLDKLFHCYRNGFLNSLTIFYGNKIPGIGEWRSIFDNLLEGSEVMSQLFPSIIEGKDFPQVEMTAALASSPKSVLQFRYFGSLLGEIFFSENGNKNDEAHRTWLLALNPDGQTKILPIPEKFRKDSSLILGYIFAIKFLPQKASLAISDLKEALKGIDDLPENLVLEEIYFYCFFWLGTLKSDFSTAFHTYFSANLSSILDRKAWLLSHNSLLLSTCQIPDKIINPWIDSKNKPQTGKSPVFKEFCKMYSGEVSKETSIQDLVSAIQPFNLFGKKSLIIFFSDINFLNKAWGLLDGIKSIQNVLLVFKYEAGLKSPESNLEIDLLIGSIKKQFVERFKQIQFQIITKNTSDNSKTDVVNNLRGFLSKYCSGANFLFITDSEFKKAAGQDYEWLGLAYSKNPVFDPKQDYLFISS
jgi:hypothetical protein